MKKNWIPIDKMTVPKATPGYVLMYTPNLSADMMYRKIPFADWEKIKNATHWQPCLPPETSPGK